LNIFIKILILLITVFQMNNALAADPGPANRQAIAQKDLNAAVAVAMKWLELLDNQKYRDAYALLDRQIKSVMSEEAWCKDKEASHKTYGKAISRNKLSAAYRDEIIGLKQGGDYIEIQYESAFERYKGTLCEIIIMTAENKGWRPNSSHTISLSTRKFKKLQSYFTVRQNKKTALTRLSQKDMDRLLGTWEGKAIYSSNMLDFRFEMSKDGSFTGFFSVPGGTELPITDMGMMDGSFVCTIRPVLAEFKGEVTDKKIQGALISAIYPDESITLKKIE